MDNILLSTELGAILGMRFVAKDVVDNAEPLEKRC